VVPLVVARRRFPAGAQRAGAALLQPAVEVEVIELLAPEHSRQSLAYHQRAIGAQRGGDDAGVELVGLAPAGGEDLVEVRPQWLAPPGRRPPRPPGRARPAGAGGGGPPPPPRHPVAH